METAGKITTLLSKKDTFDEFWTGESDAEGKQSCISSASLEGLGPGNSEQCSTDIAPVEFFDLAGSRVPGLTVRDPNITQNDLGVYALTWDNRPANLGPGHPTDATAVSDTFGLAFSVDGLNWTVYDAAMRIEPPKEATPTSAVSEIRFTGRLRHVVPVFITNEQLRLYFTSEVLHICTTGNCPGPEGGTSCSLATAVSQ